MTPEEINKEIAEYCGWSTVTNDAGTFWWHEEHNKTLPPDDDGFRSCPNYCEDLNAMHEAEKILTRHQRSIFGGYLHTGKLCTFQDYCTSEMVFKYAHLTAHQRAEAFLRTIGKWKD